ncbi:HlyD family secretion protein [Arthrobacter monumenti]
MLNQLETEPHGAPPSEERSRKPMWAAAAVVVGLVLFGGGAFTGAAAADPTSSDAYIALTDDVATVATERDEALSDLAVLEEDYDVLASGIAERESAVAQQEVDFLKAETELEEAQAKLEKAQAKLEERETAVAGAEAEKANNTISEGTWTVGVDIEPGTYRTTDSVRSSCYWSIYVSGTNSEDIVFNGIPGGGLPTVTLSEGQDFTTNRCGTWAKQ